MPCIYRIQQHFAIDLANYFWRSCQRDQPRSPRAPAANKRRSAFAPPNRARPWSFALPIRTDRPRRTGVRSHQNQTVSADRAVGSGINSFCKKLLIPDPVSPWPGQRCKCRRKRSTSLGLRTAAITRRLLPQGHVMRSQPKHYSEILKLYTPADTKVSARAGSRYRPDAVVAADPIASLSI